MASRPLALQHDHVALEGATEFVALDAEQEGLLSLSRIWAGRRASWKSTRRCTHWTQAFQVKQPVGPFLPATLFGIYRNLANIQPDEDGQAVDY